MSSCRSVSDIWVLVQKQFFFNNRGTKTRLLSTVLRIRIRIRIRRVHMFLGLLDSDPDPLVSRGTDTDPSIIKQKNLLFCDFFLTFYL